MDGFDCFGAIREGGAGNIGVNCAAMVPILGIAAGPGKFTNRVRKLDDSLETVDTSIDTGRSAIRAADPPRVATGQPGSGVAKTPSKPRRPTQAKTARATATADKVGRAAAEAAGVESLVPTAIRLSQSSVNGVEDIALSMRASGWVGDSIDVVRMPDGGLTSIDNSRVIAAHQAGINVQAKVHDFDELLPEEYIGRFTTPKGGSPTTWGGALLNRIGGQNSLYRNTYPFGSPFTGWGGG